MKCGRLNKIQYKNFNIIKDHVKVDRNIWLWCNKLHNSSDSFLIEI